MKKKRRTKRKTIKRNGPKNDRVKYMAWYYENVIRPDYGITKRRRRKRSPD